MKKLMGLILICTMLISTFSIQVFASDAIVAFADKTAIFDDMAELRVTSSSTFAPSAMEANLIYSADYDAVAALGSAELSSEKDHTTGNGKSVKLHVNASESNNRIRTKFFNAFKSSAFTTEDVGTEYTVKLWAYSPDDLNITVCTMALAQIQTMQGSSWWNSTPKYSVDASLTANTWKEITFKFTLSEEDVYYANQTGMLTIQTENGTNERTVYIDDISVTETVPTSTGAIIDKNEKGLWRKTINFDSWVQNNINWDGASKTYSQTTKYLTTTYYQNAKKVLDPSKWQSPLDKYYYRADTSGYTQNSNFNNVTREVLQSNANLRATTGIGKDLLMYWASTDGTNYYGSTNDAGDHLKLVSNVDASGDNELNLASGGFFNYINLFNMYSHKDLNSSDIGKIYKLSFDVRNKSTSNCDYYVTLKGFAPFGNMKDSEGNVYNHPMVKGYKEYSGNVPGSTKKTIELYIAIDEFMADPDYQLNIIEICTQSNRNVQLDNIVVEDTGFRVSSDFASQFMNGSYQNTAWKEEMAVPQDISISYYTGNDTSDKFVGMVSYDINNTMGEIINFKRVSPVNGIAKAEKNDNEVSVDSNAKFKFFVWDANTLVPKVEPFIIDMDAIDSTVKVKNTKKANPVQTVAEAKAAATKVN